MPVSKYVKKPVNKKRTFAKKKSANRRRTYSKNNSLVALIKKVSLKNSETKHTHAITENVQLNHNTPVIDIIHLQSTQSVGDNNTGTSNTACRVGDEVIARGLSYKFWLANKLDRPNVMYKIVFFKYKSNTTPSAPAPYYAQGTSNYMIRDLDTEQFKIVKIVKVNLENNGQRIITVGGALVGAEGHRSVNVWIPLKNMKLKYENGSGTPHFMDYGFNIVAYDSYGTATTDTIASYSYNRKFYFKDP